MKKLVLSTFVAFLLMFLAYSVAAENDDAALSFSSFSIEDGVSGRIQVKAQQIYVISQQFFNFNMAQRLGFNQGQIQTSQNMQSPQSY